jgi:enoyl-CoA hydratase/carnithine racemase
LIRGTLLKYETIFYEVADKILTITLNRPEKLNAFTAQMMLDLIDAFDRADADDEVRVVIVTGSGRAFCAGADLSGGVATFEFATNVNRAHGPGSAVGIDGEVDWAHEAIRDTAGRVALRIYDCLKPVIAAVNGPAVGAGATILLPMDIRIASSTARFGFVFSRRGIVPEACSSWFLPRIVGISRALEWCYSGRVFPATEALEHGLVRSLHEPSDLISVAQALAREIVDNAAPLSVALIRQMLWRMLGADHPIEAHKIDSRGVFALGRNPDATEGVVAFLEKRPARFTGTVSRDLPQFVPWWKPRSFI